MTYDRLSKLLSVCALAVAAMAAPAAAQEPVPAQQPAAQEPAAPEDDAALNLAEPEYRLINLPTTMLLPRRGMSFDLTHRFGGNLAQGSFSDHAKSLFGLDQGAVIGLEFRYAIARRVQTAIYRTSFSRTIQLHGKVDAIRQAAGSPVSISPILAIEGTENLSDDFAPSLGAVLSRTMNDRVALYATPVWVHNSAAASGVTRNTFFAGLGGRFRIGDTVYLAGEVSPRLAGYKPGRPEFAFAIEKRAGGHIFQLNLTNTFSTTYAQVARGGFADSLYLGFNLARKFF